VKRSTVEEACAVLFIAAGREAGEAEFLVWERALADTPDDQAQEVVTRILQMVDLGARFGPPTPALFLAERAAMLGQEPPGHNRHSGIELYRTSARLRGGES